MSWLIINGSGLLIMGVVLLIDVVYYCLFFSETTIVSTFLEGGYCLWTVWRECLGVGGC